MKCIKSITLVFENCEHYTLNEKDLGYIFIGNISADISRIASNAIAQMNTAKSVALEIFKEGNKTDYKPFGQTDWEDENVFERIVGCNDITCLDVTYEDDTEESFFVDYDVKEDYLGAPNINMSTYLSSLGNLYIVIEEGKTVWDYYDKEEIEDEDCMNFEKEMVRD